MRKMAWCVTPSRQPHIILDTHNCWRNNFSYNRAANHGVRTRDRQSQGPMQGIHRGERITDLIMDDQHTIEQDGERKIQDWNEFTETDDVEFREEFQSAMLDKRIPEQDESFTSDVFGDTYLNKEIALMRGAGDSSDSHYG